MLLYHEKQVAALCGVHCINALLQGPMFSEVDLAGIRLELHALERAAAGTLHQTNRPTGQQGIGLELDALERAVMEEGGMTGEDYLTFAAEESSNVANDGMFSIQCVQNHAIFSRG
ncbi:hypothetical protein FOA52_008710 [Chlamydomonas sp. UWO 241]|nr:hypothetical protein FOA52_008710 [Chlamydomonas sp. UWO 241]